MSEETGLLAPWEPTPMKTGETRVWQMGPLKLYICRSPQELHIATEEQPEEEHALTAAEPVEPPDEVEWKRWANPEGRSRVRLAPRMPDRAVVVRPKSPLAFPPGSGGALYARIPVWVQVFAGEPEQEVALSEVPSLALSNTWFGPDTTEGELCYSLTSALVSERERLKLGPHRAVCAVHLQNEAESALEVERLCIRAPYLSLYGAEGLMWSTEVSVDHRTEDGPNRIDYNDSWFRGRDGVTKLSEPRMPVSGGIMARSFAAVASLGNMI